MHAYSWAEICKPKEEGGLGIRKLEDINASAGLKLIWKLCTTDSLWSLWMRERYYKNNTFWEASISSLDSGTWKFLTNLQEVAANNMSQNFETGSWSWNATSNGSFTFKSAWNIIRCPSSVFEFNTLIWYAANSPKMSCCLLRVLKNRLLIQDRLHNFRIIQELQCVLCNTGIESIQQCPYTSCLWTLCKLKLQLHPSISNLVEEAQNLIIKFKKKMRVSYIARISFSATIWHTWQMVRNRRIFQLEQMSKILVFRNLYEDIHILVQNCHWKSTGDQKDNEILSNWGMY